MVTHSLATVRAEFKEVQRVINIISGKSSPDDEEAL